MPHLTHTPHPSEVTTEPTPVGPNQTLVPTGSGGRGVTFSWVHLEVTLMERHSSMHQFWRPRLSNLGRAYLSTDASLSWSELFSLTIVHHTFAYPHLKQKGQYWPSHCRTLQATLECCSSSCLTCLAMLYLQLSKSTSWGFEFVLESPASSPSVDPPTVPPSLLGAPLGPRDADGCGVHLISTPPYWGPSRPPSSLPLLSYKPWWR